MLLLKPNWTRFLVMVLGGYKIFISPLFATLGFARCRFAPTCSEYSTMAIKKYGITKGLILAIKRFANCQPYGSLND